MGSLTQLQSVGGLGSLRASADMVHLHEQADSGFLQQAPTGSPRLLLMVVLGQQVRASRSEKMLFNLLLASH